MKRAEQKKKTRNHRRHQLCPRVCAYFSQYLRVYLYTSHRSNFNDQFLMVCRCSGLCFFSFFFFYFFFILYFGLLLLLLSLPLSLLLSSPPPTTTCALFFVHLYYFFLVLQTPYLGRRIGLCFIYRRFARCSFLCFFLYTRPAPFSPPPSFTRARRRRRRTYLYIYIYKNTLRELSCAAAVADAKKKQPIRSCAESWNSAAVLFQLSFSTSHRSGFMRCRAVHGS
ncbi:unnamed protein product [Aphis gossypii]|uniref:Uncharacterized protein n=1 Tax=Aphis gossypii TaxID=80765 RepID=A0A9P0ITG5_APHGO|nr:unnamed protein product [Aphis gossypii]